MIMPVFRISKEDRAKILNVTVSVLDQAKILIDTAWGENPPRYLSWYDACQQVDPKTDHGKYHYIVDNGHHDHGTHHTMTFSNNVAVMLERELGIKPVFFHKVEHASKATILEFTGGRMRL